MATRPKDPGDKTTSKSWCENRGADLVRINLAIQPGARRTEILGPYDGCLKIKVAAPPVDGAANSEVLEFIAKQLKVRPRQVVLVSGATSRRKVIDVEGISLDIVQKNLDNSDSARVKAQKRQ